MTSTAQIYGYVRASSLSPSGLLDLQTSGGTTTAGPAAHPRFFSGFLGEAEPAAAALLGVANVAQARYWRPNLAALRDPVVTCNGDRLRFESFSGCCGVYARLDVLDEGMDGMALDRGTTNVDVNNELRLALTRVRGGDPLKLEVGPEGLEATTFDEAEVFLAPDLVATLGGLLGVSQGSLVAGGSGSGSGAGGGGGGVGTGYPEVAPYVPRPLLPPIGSPAELAEVVASLTHAEPVEAMVFERVLEAIVAFERADPAALQEAMRPVVEGPWRVSEQTALTPGTALLVVTVAAAGLYEDARRHPHRASVQRLWLRARTKNRGWYNRRRTTPADFLILRAAEVQAALGLPDLPPLVAVPTSPSGFIAPETLAARLRECEALGTEPLDADFHQALLRLPADCGDADVSGLTSVAGLRFAAWVAGERIALPEADIPEPKVRELDRDSSHAETSRRAARGHAVAPGTLLDLAPGVWREPERCWDGSDWMACWPAILPSRPDLAAMAMIGGVDWGTAPASVASAVVLAEHDGAQDATHRVIAARLVSEDVQLRASGVDAALVLAARGLLDAAALGAALAAEVAAAPAGLRRAVPALRDLANGGAARVVWEATAVMLPVLLPPAVPKTLSGTADLLVLATELAGTLGVRTPIAEVGALAQKKGGSAVVGAARRLEAVLGAG